MAFADVEAIVVLLGRGRGAELWEKHHVGSATRVGGCGGWVNGKVGSGGGCVS